MINAKICSVCKNGSEGFDSMDGEMVKNLGNIEVRMNCGCGGSVNQAILNCTSCKSYYLDSYEEHWAPHNEHMVLQLVEKKAAEELIKKWKKCINDKNCECEIHKNSERLSVGKEVYSESIAQD